MPEKPRLPPLYRRRIFGNTTKGGGGCQIDTSNLLRVKLTLDSN